MNISNYSFDSKNEKTKLQIKHLPVKIVLIAFLLVIMIFMIVFYLKLKKDKSGTGFDTYENLVTGEDTDFVSSFNIFQSMYGYQFSLYLTGENDDHYYLGEFLQKIYPSGDLYISGMIYDSGAEFTIYPGVSEELNQYCCPVVINETGIYVLTENTGYILYPDDIEQGSKAGYYYVRVADGMRGSEIMKEFQTAFTESLNERRAFSGRTQANLPAIKVIQWSIHSDSFLSPIVNGYQGEMSLSFDTRTTDNGLEIEILCDGERVSFRFNATEQQMFKKVSHVEEYISTDDFWKLFE